MNKKIIILILLIGAVIGMITLGGSAYVLNKTSTTEFCVSCHTMDRAYEEYKVSKHFTNNKGIRAECADCHIPQEPLDYLITKIRASKDVYHEFITGRIDSPEKYENHRLEMAESVWATLRANDSSTCRSCHNRDAMDPYEQTKNAMKMHAYGDENNQTCIDCHKGVAHFAPEIKLDSKAFDALSALTAETSQDAATVYPFKSIGMGSLGTILPATELQVISSDSDKRTVQINGYQMKGAEKVMYIAEGQRAIIALLSEEGIGKLVLGDFKEDIYGNQWASASLTAEINEPVLDKLKPLWRYADQLDNVYCSTCHSKIPPDHFTVNAWATVVKSMGERTNISVLNLQILTKFLQSNAKDSTDNTHEL
ncbi:MAG: trimethylamine-N-oxide reductase (cytochrome c) cytochrome c-type subunit TorY [Paraglaciecola sp.]|jgi:trimethylamine-N-oxide reductase (cytochrome c) cytochrome c-type subunit TorY